MALKFQVDLELLRKYNCQGPRYTSYPTAPHFQETFSAKDYLAEIQQGNSADDLSLYFHFPYCKKLCYFCACNMIVTHNLENIERYLAYLKKEISLLSQHLQEGRKVAQLHWGGGTPSYLSPAQMSDIFRFIQDHFALAGDAEISIEMDPRNLTPEHLPTLRELGFNRLSFGVQDFNPQVQKAINRMQPEAMIRDLMNKARQLGFASVNVDLIYGLPYQTLASFTETIDKIIDIAPDRIAVFSYAHVPWLKKHQRVIPEDKLPAVEEKLRMLQMTIERLTSAGYHYIGMDHFAKEQDELTRAWQNQTLHRNFQGYTTHRNVEVYAMGITAISQLHNVYAQNVKDIKTYKQCLERNELPTAQGYRLNQDDQLRRYVITEIMCNSQIVKAQIEHKFAIRFDDYFGEALEYLQQFVADGLLTLEDKRIIIHDPGRLVLRNIAMGFDRYLPKQQGQRIYSSTV